MIRLKEIAKKYLHKTAAYTWPTKGYEVWLVIQNLLFLTRPARLVEFGCGRSTNYLAEYALKYNAQLVSFEQHLLFTLRINFGLKLSFLPFHVVKYAPITGDWYNTNVVDGNLASFEGIDCLFYDGPAEFGCCKRNSRKFYEHIVPRLRDVKLMIFDDVHREESSIMARDLARKFQFKRYDMKYSKRKDENGIAFLFKDDADEIISKIPVYLRDLLVLIK